MCAVLEVSIGFYEPKLSVIFQNKGFVVEMRDKENSNVVFLAPPQNNKVRIKSKLKNNRTTIYLPSQVKIIDIKISAKLLWTCDIMSRMDLSSIFSLSHLSHLKFSDTRSVPNTLVTFPEGFYYKDVYFPQNDVFYGIYILSCTHLKSNYMKLHTSKLHTIPKNMFPNHRYLITGYYPPPEDTHPNVLAKFKKALEWKEEAVLAILTADLYEDDEYSWK
jgi:hypothetical protein